MRYDGGKGQAGVYQKIINQMPPHRIYIEACLGMGAVMRVKRPAEISYGVEIDSDVLEEWRDVNLPGLRLRRSDAITFLDVFPWSGNECVYCDPPYLKETRSDQNDIYRYEMTDEQHEELLMVIKRIPAPVIISGYWSEMYADALKGWRTLSFSAIKRNGERSTEWLWCNFPEPLELHDYNFLGEDFRDRQRIRRKRERWEKKLRSMPGPECYSIMAALETLRTERAQLLSGGSDVSVAFNMNQ
jgi:DNA adenine methylase